MEDLNKITSTRVGDSIHFFVNGAEDSGTVVKMDTSFVTVVKDDGKLQDIHINDTFFIKDILVNKSWNDMTMEERTVELHKVHAYSPRFLAKSWKELPQPLKDVILEKGIGDKIPTEKLGDLPIGKPDGKVGGTEIESIGGTKRKLTSPADNYGFKNTSNVEQSHLGSAGRGGQVVETNTDFDAPDDYEGQTEDEKEEQFKHEKLKPKTTNKTMQEQLWEEWLDKGEGGMGDGSAPANNGSSSTNENGMYNPVYGEKGRHGGQSKDKEEETEKDKEADEKERKG